MESFSSLDVYNNIMDLDGLKSIDAAMTIAFRKPLEEIKRYMTEITESLLVILTTPAISSCGI